MKEIPDDAKGVVYFRELTKEAHAKALKESSSSSSKKQTSKGAFHTFVMSQRVVERRPAGRGWKRAGRD